MSVLHDDDHRWRSSEGVRRARLRHRGSRRGSSRANVASAIAYTGMVCTAMAVHAIPEGAVARERELIAPNEGEKRYGRRDEQGRFTDEQGDVGRSLAQD